MSFEVEKVYLQLAYKSVLVLEKALTAGKKNKKKLNFFESKVLISKIRHFPFCLLFLFILNKRLYLQNSYLV